MLVDFDSCGIKPDSKNIKVPSLPDAKSLMPLGMKDAIVVATDGGMPKATAKAVPATAKPSLLFSDLDSNFVLVSL